MKVFVTGVGGLLGHDVVNELERKGHSFIGSDVQATGGCAPYVQLDITNEATVKKVIEELRPDAIIHCAAWTQRPQWMQ